MPQTYLALQEGFFTVEMIGLILSVIGLIVAFIALIVGFWHVYEIRDQVKELKKQTDQAQAHTKSLDILRRELPTRYIGQFPDYLQQIIDLFGRAEKEIVIFCDFPAYGSFSSPRRFVKYRQGLEDKLADNVPVQLTCLNTAGRMKVTRKQFSRKPWDEWIKDPQNDQQLKWFLKHHNKSNELTGDEFIALLEEDDDGMLNIMRGAGAEVYEANRDIPLCYWLVDNREAIFAIIVLSDNAIEYGFRTTDQQLINALSEMRQQYLQQQ
jgi:hypothetical protein